MPELCKHTPLAHLNRVHHPRYSTRDCLPSVQDVKRAKTEYLKFEFPHVSETNEWFGQWIVKKKDVTKLKKFNNAGLECYVLPLDKLSPLKLADKCIHEI